MGIVEPLLSWVEGIFVPRGSIADTLRAVLSRAWEAICFELHSQYEILGLIYNCSFCLALLLDLSSKSLRHHSTESVNSAGSGGATT